MMKTMFVVLVRRCQEVRPIGQHCPMTTEREKSSLVAFHSLFTVSCDHHLYHHHGQFGGRVNSSYFFSWKSVLAFLSPGLSISGCCPPKNYKMNAAGKCDSHSWFLDCFLLVSCKIRLWQQEREMMHSLCFCIQVCKNVCLVCLYLSICIWVSVIICTSVCGNSICVMVSVCVLVEVCLCFIKARQVFLVFRAVQRRPLQGRGVGGRQGQHAQLWGSLASRRGHSPPHFLWWTDGPCSAWLQKKTTNERKYGGRVEKRVEMAE